MGKFIKRFLSFYFLLTFVSAAPSFAEVQGIPATAVRAQQSVVTIHVTKHYSYRRTYEDLFAGMFLRDFTEGNREYKYEGKYEKTGSGVIISESGLVLTNAHMVRDVNKIKVVLEDKKEYSGILLGKDNKADLALLQIEGGASLIPLAFARVEEIQVGQEVLAIGSPYGYKHTVTKGIVSGIKREVKLSKYNTMVNLIQTDAALNPGNSGGPLITNDGKMIGLNTLGRGQNLNFAVSIETINTLLPDLKAGGRDVELHNRFVWRFGFDVEEMVDDEGWQSIEIVSVPSDSEAYKVGLREKDILYQIKNIYPKDSDHLFEYVENEISSGEKAKLKIKRDDRIFFTYLGAIRWEIQGKRYH
jgi:S1-C subfamily serine protease